MDLRKRRSQEKLQNALAEHLQTKTIDEITIGELSKTAGVSRQTFYSNFDSKQSILVARVEALFQRGQQHFESFAHRTDLSREEVVELGFRYLLEECQRDRVLMRAAFSGQAGIRSLSLGKKLMTKSISDRIVFMYDYNFNEAELAIISQFYSGAFIGVIQGWLLDDTQIKDINFVTLQIGRLMPHGMDAYLKNHISEH